MRDVLFKRCHELRKETTININKYFKALAAIKVTKQKRKNK